MPDADRDAPRDVNEQVVEEWRADTTAGVRVRQILDVTSEPQSAAAIAERARVSEPTARKHLESLAEAGYAKAVAATSGTRYVRSPQALATDRIAAIHREYTSAELRESIRELKTERAELREAHGVDSADELALALGGDDAGWEDLRRLQELEENLDVAQAALALYGFDPDDTSGAATQLGDSDLAETDERGTGDEERGAFADDRSQSSA